MSHFPVSYCWAFTVLMMTDSFGATNHSQLHGSQFPRPGTATMAEEHVKELVDLRVQRSSTYLSGAEAGIATAKTLGLGNPTSAEVHWTRKRALRRARRRAQDSNGTFYRGQWQTSSMLGVRTVANSDPSTPATRRRDRPTNNRTQSRRVRCTRCNMKGLAPC